jgi:dTDP-4-dehydrorhamnose reductase
MLGRSRVLVLGGSGLVGSGVRQRWSGAVDVEAPGHAELDVLDQRALERYVERSTAVVVLNLAAWADVDGAEVERGDTRGTVYRLNAAYPKYLARACHREGKHLIHVSTDYVFDGKETERPYAEDDTPNPVCWYAQTKLDGERAVLDSGASASVARIEMPFTGRATGKRDLARLIASRLRAGQRVQGVVDQRITPVFLDYAAEAFRKLAETRYLGIIHLAATDWTTPHRFAREIAGRLNLNARLIEKVPFERFSRTRLAPRPQHPWLDVSRFEQEFGGGILRAVDEELSAWVEQFSQVVSPA